MNLTCTICSDGIVASSEIYATHCGHLFHYPCLIQWIERSKTCPQCRYKTTEKNMHRIYLNHTNLECSGDDFATLQSKYDNVQFQLMLKEKDVKNLSEKYNRTKQQNITLRETISELEGKTRSYDSVIHNLKDQISFLKCKAKERDKVMDELTKFKTKLKQMENIELAVNGSREEVTEMLKNENDVDSLVILVATLKKALLDVEKKKINMEHKFKQLQTDITKYRKEITFLETKNKELQKRVDVTDSLSVREINSPRVITNKLEEVHPEVGSAKRKTSFENQGGQNTSLVGMLHSEKEKTVKTVGVNSPYLNIKKGCSSLDFPLQKTGCNVKTLSRDKQVSIFKKPKSNISTIASSRSEIMMYNGLGGQSKEDVYPAPNSELKYRNTGIKRNSIDVGASSSKFRKVN
ncbi:hypothetical protein Zmor_021999 [Zophobas morio]|uniref:RING-type domain-containing protein n=1 Tax=Zophobas morio TaxID=2755281 RepID=A0AA38MBX6_9CUCU|nr:hypothetical protein Zmor_021999 [Zophobas morio]